MLDTNTTGVTSGVGSNHTGVTSGVGSNHTSVTSGGGSNHMGVTSGVGSTHTGVTSGVGSNHTTRIPEFTLGFRLFGFPVRFTLSVPDERFISNVSSALYKHHFRFNNVL
jgi:hypothetical protein